MSNYTNYRQRDTTQEKADIEREIAEATKGFVFLREFPEFGKAIQLAKEVTKLLEPMPSDRWLCWCDQIERASVSTCCNIAEAVGRGTINQLAQYLRVARGSAFETLTCLLCAPVEVPDTVKELGQEVCRLLCITVKEVGKERLSRL